MKTKEEYDKKRQDLGQIADKQQREAANPLKSVWVEASAGTGKTKILSDRVLRLLLNKVQPNRILCLTYTKAAAVEMNTRITGKLSRWSVVSEEELEENIIALLGDEVKNSQLLQDYKKRARTLFAVLLDTPGGIKIKTIHSFCQEILKKFPLEAGISPYFEVMDDQTAQASLEKIKTDLLQKLEIKSDSPIMHALQYLTTHLSEYNFPKAVKHITDNRVKISEILQKCGGYENFVLNLAQKLQINPTDTEADLYYRFWQNTDESAIRTMATALAHGGTKDLKSAEILTGLLESKAGEKEKFANYKSVFFSGDEIKKTLAYKESVNFNADLPNIMQKEAERIYKFLQDIKHFALYNTTIAIFNVADELIYQYEEFKKQKAVLDYEDLIQITRKLLSDSSVATWVLFKLDGGIDHVLVDEAQDNSSAQWDIIKALCGDFFDGNANSENKRTIFAVGDRKQSIYSFQGANPDKFDAMADYYAEKIGADFHKVNLEVSFRSSAAILDIVNLIFSQPEIYTGVVAKDERVNHIPFRAGEAGRVEVWPLLCKTEEEKKQEAEDEFYKPKISLSTKLAQKIADKINELIQKSRSSTNPLHFRDFMILVQTRNSFVNEFVRVCKEKNINISGADKLQLSDQIAVQDLISLGKFLLLPNDDLSLAEVLKSPLFGLNDDDLFSLCYNRGNVALWVKLGDNPQYKEIYVQLQDLLNKTGFIRPFELFNYVLTKLNGRYKFTERMGVEVEDGLDEFINLTLSYEQEHTPTLQGFIKWICARDIEIKRETEQSDSDAVRIMTVHRSKGLQAPIVFLPDCVHMKSAKREQDLLTEEDFALYPRCKDDYDEICNNFKTAEFAKSLEEYRRLLYVALTRAEDRLYICGYSGKGKPNENSWYALCQKSLAGSDMVEKSDNGFTYEVPETVVKKVKDGDVSEIVRINEAEWIKQNAPEESSLAHPYTPSKPEEDEEPDSVSPLVDNGYFYKRGTLIHKLLQFIPQNNENSEQIINTYLQKNANDFSNAQKAQISKEVMKLITNLEFAEIFGKYSRAEVPIMGEVNGKIISAQIDRLIILPEKIIIVDFKTNRPPAKNPAETPNVYIHQLAIYAELIKKIYPSKPVETYILWTNETRLMRIS